jgi:bisphosphoglycerate-dependent phosphoglycerate mutase
MNKLTLSPLFDIQLFGEGAGGAGGGTGGGDAGGAPAAGQNAAAPAQPQTRGVKGNPLANVQYGKQEDAAPAAPEQINTEERTARFEELIKGEFKDLYGQRVQEAIQRRLKGNEATVQKYNALAPVLDLLAGKYGVKADDVEALSKAIEEDETFYEDEALEKGLTVEQVKSIRKMERENAELKAQMEQQKSREFADAQVAEWARQAEAVKQIYPSFDLQAEAENEQFLNLLRSNVPVQTAYEVIHKDEIIPAAMQFTAQKVTEKVANSVRAGQRRPVEGAMASTAAVLTKSDVSQLTRADREEIARRVAAGEKIRF